MESDAKILLVGSHAILMGAIAARLEHELHCVVVGVVATPRQAVEKLIEQAADIVLIDADSGWTHGDGRIDALYAARPGVHIILISATIEDALVECALMSGVHGILLKEELPATLGKVIHEVLAGGACFPPAVRSRIIVDGSGMRLATRQAESNDRPDGT